MAVAAHAEILIDRLDPRQALALTWRMPLSSRVPTAKPGYATAWAKFVLPASTPPIASPQMSYDWSCKSRFLRAAALRQPRSPDRKQHGSVSQQKL